MKGLYSGAVQCRKPDGSLHIYYFALVAVNPDEATGAAVRQAAVAFPRCEIATYYVFKVPDYTVRDIAASLGMTTPRRKRR